MKPIEIIEQIKQTNPAALKGVDDKAAARLLRLVFADIAEQIKTSEDGVVAVTGLGRFRVKTVEVEKDGVKTARKRIVFTQAPTKKDAAAE
jgi:hypothetical protein